MEAKNLIEKEAPRVRRRDVLVFSSGDSFQPFAYSVGRPGSRFLTELRDHKRFMGLKCPSCAKVYIPPRSLCGPCWKQMQEWVEVGPGGYLEAFTVLRFAFVDPETGLKKPVPYGYGFIRLDGASTNLQHFIKVDGARPLRIGMRLRPVFEENRNATLRDIRYFEEAP